MRLGQLSRKLQVKTADIIEVLETKFDVTLNNHPNSKVPEELLAELEEIFKKEEVAETPTPTIELPIDEVESEPVDITDNSDTEPEENPQEEEIEEKQEEPIAETVEAIVPEESSTSLEDEAELNIVDGIIKAPKVEVAGIKIIGKIDLPEKKVDTEENVKAEENSETEQENPITDENGELSNTDNPSTNPPTEDEKTEVKKEYIGEKPRPTVRKSKPRRAEKVLLTPEEERKIKLKEAQKKKLEEQKAAKIKRRETYSQELKQKSTWQQKSKKSKAKKHSSNKMKVEKPTTVWGKFIYWLNN